MPAVEMLSEPVCVPDTYVSGLACIEHVGDGVYRLTFYAQQKSLYGGIENIVTCRLIATLPAMLDGAKQVMLVGGRACCGAVVGRGTRH